MTVAETVVARVGSRRALITLSAILFLTFLDTTILSVALSDLQATLHTTVSEIQWVVNAYAASG
jgi:MFS family permease